MYRKVYSDFFTEDATCYSSHTIPEKTLLAAILERAVRDLTESVPIEDTKAAIKWFNRRTMASFKTRIGFSFRDCVEMLEISGEQENFLLEKVRHAELCVADCNCRREESGKTRNMRVQY